MYTNRPVSNLSDDFRFLGSAKIGPIPVIIIVFFVMFAISAFLLTQTRFGKNVYAIGGNDQAARVAGINVEKNLILVYIWCSVVCGNRRHAACRPLPVLRPGKHRPELRAGRHPRRQP